MARAREVGMFTMEDESPSSSPSPSSPMSPTVSQAATLTTILSPKIVACSLRSRDDSLKELLTLLFFSDEFFAFTDTGDEISLFLEEHVARTFPDSALQESRDRLRAIQIREGVAAGYIQRYTAPLAEKGVNVLYLSTFLSTSSGGSGRASKIAEEALLSPIEGSLKVIQCPRSNIAAITRALLRLILFLNESGFLSITANGDEVTITLPESDLKKFSKSELSQCDINDATWRAIHLGAGARGVGPAMVNQIAGVLGTNGVSIFYLSTSNDDFILVEGRDLPRALGLLQNVLETS